MTEQDLEVVGEMIGEAVGESLKDVIFGVVAVFTILRKQPGFDNSAFNVEVNKALELPGFSTMTKKVFAQVLDAQEKL